MTVEGYDDEEGFPDWYWLLKSANYLHVQPWTLAGIEYPDNRIPICWMNWAQDIVRCEAELQDRKLRAMNQTR